VNNSVKIYLVINKSSGLGKSKDWEAAVGRLIFNPRSVCSAIGSIRESDHLEKISKFLVDILLLEPKSLNTTVRSVGVCIETMSAS